MKKHYVSTISINFLTFCGFDLNSVHESFSSSSLDNSGVKLLQFRNHDVSQLSRMFSQFLLF